VARELDEKWSSLRFGEVKVSTEGGQHNFEVQVYLNGLAPEAVRVELFAGGDPPVTQEMRTATAARWDRARVVVWRAGLSRAPGAGLHGAHRAEPPGVAVPLEAAYILWQH
jgi:starch phosphorylase